MDGRQQVKLTRSFIGRMGTVRARVFPLVALALLISPSIARSQQDVAAANQDELISQHISNLGHPSYAVRLRARLELERLGLAALEAIREAEESSDTEIAFAARYLMSNLEVQWAKESDPLAVQQILTEYGAQRESERKSRMDQLAGLPNHQGLVPLARLVRYEQSLRLSRLAALLIIRPDTSQPPLEETLLVRLEQTIGESRRPAAHWLRQYCQDQRTATYDQPAWDKFIREERDTIENGGRTGHSDSIVLLELYRACAASAQACDRKDEAMRLALASLDQIAGRRQDLMDAVSWALDNQMQDVVLELQRREPKRFASEAELLYGVAEAYLLQGDQEQARSISQQALQIDPIPAPGSPEATALTADALEMRAMRHREIGGVLQTRGRFDWAQGEYRHVIENLPLESMSATTNRAQLALLLADQQLHQEVVEVLQPMVDRLQKDSIYHTKLRQQLLLDPQEYVGMYYYHQSFVEEASQSRQALSKALQQDPHNPDIMIAMFRTPGDAEWQKQTYSAIDSSLRRSEILIERIETMLKQNRGMDDLQLELARFCNNFAWLAANTEREVDKAIKFAQRAVQMYPQVSAYQDTLARCYFAAGDLDQAIFYQQIALKLEPHLPPLRRQLEFFQQQKIARDAAEPK